MSGQIMFFKKSIADLANTDVVLTASEGDDFADFVRNRNNFSAWLTTGSTDASNTTFEIDFIDAKPISDILLLKHNFKAYTIQYWDGSTYQNFSPSISETTNTAESNYYRFTQVSSSKVKLTITGTQTANAEKFLYQFIVTSRLGQLNAWPIISDPLASRNKKKNQTLSGKMSIAENVGFFSCKLGVKILTNETDLVLIETLFGTTEGFLVWINGNSDSQFRSLRQGYRKEDLFLMKCSNEWSPEYYKGLYQSGIVIDMKLEEVID